jgi:Fe-S-cluster containining protein
MLGNPLAAIFEMLKQLQRDKINYRFGSKMKLMKIYDDLPELYKTIFPEFFAQEIPVEEMATCNDCAMCQKPGTRAIPGIQYFRPDAKCCTYYPKLSNYLVGGILSDPDPGLEEGRRRIRERIEKRVAVKPQALYFPKRYRLMHKYGMPQSFGRSSTMLCPYYVKENGLCSIWKFRDAMCSTYFCKTVAGNEGQKFWKVLRTYINHAEGSLCLYPLYKMNWDIESTWDYYNDLESATLQPEDLDETAPSEESYQKMWRDWVGREEEFYRESYRIVSELTRDEFNRIAGITGNVILSWLKEKYNDVIESENPASVI